MQVGLGVPIGVPRQPAKTGRPRERAKYDAAHSAADPNHWRNADILSAGAANSLDVRQRLRSRSRYEVSNNSYARGAILTLGNDLVGSGPRLQIAGDREAFRGIERAWQAWVDDTGFAEKLRTLAQAKKVDGEAFALLVTNSKLPGVQLDVRPLECDHFSDPSALPAPNTADGIRFDSAGNPVSYTVLREHPGDQLASQAFNRFPAAQVIHWFRQDRPGQVRGVPEITPALPLFALHRRFTLATVTAAEVAAAMGAAVIKAGIGANAEELSTESEAWDIVEFERGAMTTLPFGYDLSQLKAEHPNTTYPDFKRELLNEIGACINMPEVIIGNTAAGYNFSSARCDMILRYRGAIRVERDQCQLVVLDRLFRVWLEEAAAAGIIPAGIDADAMVWSWVFPGWAWIDPKNDATADTERLDNGTSTHAEICSETGRDWEDVMEQRAKEVRKAIDLAKKYDLPEGWDRADKAPAVPEPPEPEPPAKSRMSALLNGRAA